MRSTIPFAAVLMLAACSVRGQSASLDAGDDSDRAKTAAYEKAELTITLQQIDARLGQTNAAIGALKKLRQQIDTYDKWLHQLRTNDDGKRLGAVIDTLNASKLRTLITDPLVEPDLLDALSNELDAIRESLVKLRQDPPPGFIPSPAQEDEIGNIDQRIQVWTSHVTDSRDWLNNLLAAASANADVSKLPTLDIALNKVIKDDQADRIAAERSGIAMGRGDARSQVIAAARIAELERISGQTNDMLRMVRAELEKSGQENEMQIQKMQNDMEQKLLDLKEQLAKAQGQREVQSANIDASTEKARLEAGKIRLRQEMKRPEVMAALAPFLTPGYLRPNGQSSYEKKPLSWTDIQACGATQPNENGLYALYGLGVNRRDALRPRFPFQTSYAVVNANPANQEFLRQVQQYLIKYGPLLAEDGYLAP